MRKPVIGIPCFAFVRADTQRPIYASNQAYVQAIERAGGAPVLIPPMSSADALVTIRSQLDGLLLAGGSDVDPTLYGEDAIPECKSLDPERDRLELELAQWALQRRLPTFGICRGMQVLNVAAGGSLYQDIATQLRGGLDHLAEGKARSHIAHDIRLDPSSTIAGILGSDRIDVNSFHHQSVKRLGQGFSVVAVAQDGVVEAMETADAPFLVAVQYHPEELERHDPGSQRLFQAFVAAASRHKGD